MGIKNETKREPDRVRHDIGIIIGTEEGIKSIKMTTASTLKFIEKIKKEMEE